MSENIKNGLLVLVAVVTLANTVMIMTDDDVSYEKTERSNAAVSNAAVNANQSAIQADLNANTPDPGFAPPQQSTGPATQIQFAEMAHDFGAIEQNTTNNKTFTFTNTGENPLIISDAKGSCGCTVPEYPKEPIPPGGTGEIQVVYRPGTQKNKQTKTVTITANTEPATTVLRITADVNPGEGGLDNTPQQGQAIQIGS